MKIDLKGTTSTFYAAKDVLHIYLKDRPGQDFGVPFSTTSLITLKDFKDYQDAELLKSNLGKSDEQVLDELMKKKAQ